MCDVCCVRGGGRRVCAGTAKLPIAWHRCSLSRSHSSLSRLAQAEAMACWRFSAQSLKSRANSVGVFFVEY